MEELPLKNLFTQLQKAGLPIGLGEYQLLLKALQGGFGLHNRSELRQLCQLLWTKSKEEKKLLNYHFDQMMGQIPDNELGHNLKASSLHRNQLAVIVASLLLCVGSTLMIARYVKEPAKNLLEPPVFIKQSPKPPPFQSPNQKPSTIEYVKTFEWIWWISFGMIVLGAGAILTWLIDKLIFKQSHMSASNPSTQTLSKATQTIDDEIRTAQATQLLIGQSLATHFLLNGDYLPVTQRQMKRSWRYLSRPVRKGIPTELDINATIQQISQRGVLLNPVLVPPRVNGAALLMLIDHDGSMEPFHSLTERLVVTAERGGRLGQLGVYYFHNCPIPSWKSPGDYLLYSDISAPSSSQSISYVLTRFTSPQLSVLIISDAGAARGGFSPYRIEQTQIFLKILGQRVRNLAWINPLPRARWLGTTAAAIAEQVPMFEADRLGVDTAISILRGKNREA